MRTYFYIFISVLTVSGCSSQETTEDLGAWGEYELSPPTDEQKRHLLETPYRYPTQSCKPATEVPNLPDDVETTETENGEEVCVWNSPTAVAPVGVNFSEIGSCDHVFTQAPSWFVHPEREFQSSASLLEDPAFLAELQWAQQEIRSSGCSCCHSSQAGSNYASSWDSDAPDVWTDTISNARLYLLSGAIVEHKEFGEFPPEMNHGARRGDVMIPSSDPERLSNFLLAEFERRGGNEEDRAAAQRQMTALFSRKTVEPRECIAPFEGLIDGVLTWNGDDTARQIYIQEVGSEVPGFPPNLDRPEGTVWAIRVPYNIDAIPSGTLAPGDLPEGAIQLIPEDGSEPTFESGQQYRFFATPDVMLLNVANCLFESP